ncbi:hypothetical protein V8E51_015192 [Hyaloscypha variabilis]
MGEARNDIKGEPVQIAETAGDTATAHWKTGFWYRFPWMGILALLIVLCTVGAAAGVLAASDQQPIGTWRVQPTVYLSIASTIATIALGIALGQGVIIAWWTRAMADGATRATVVGPLDVVLNKNLTIPIARAFPRGFTGQVSGRGSIPTSINSNFTTVLREYAASLSIPLPASGCIGNCTGLLEGAGYTILCVNSSAAFNIPENDTATGGAVFSTVFNYDGYGPITYNATVQEEQAPSCNGSVLLVYCTLSPATITYPILVTNDTISLQGSYQTDHTAQARPEVSGSGSGPSTHGGMYLALQALFGSSSTMSWGGGVAWIGSSTGVPAAEYIQTDFSVTGCYQTWSDPTSDILNAARELAFRSALYIAANKIPFGNLSELINWTSTELVDLGNYPQSIQVLQSNSETTYHSQYGFFAAATVFILLGALSVTPLYIGWWTIGRKVTLSPIELAKAFASPLLVDAPDANASLDSLLVAVGHLPARYGAVAVGNATTLRLDNPERISKPEQGFTYIGQGRCYGYF